MKNVKKSLLALLLIASMTASMASCGGSGSTTSSAPAESSKAESSQTAESSKEESSEAASTPADSTDAQTLGSTPRNETVYFAGQQWGTINDFNPLSAGSNNWCMAQGDASRVFVYESLFIYNMLDGKLYPLLGTGYA